MDYVNDISNSIERRKKFFLENKICTYGSSGEVKWCLTVVVAVRGTKFTSEIKDNSGIQVMVFEGIVDINNSEKNKTLSIDAGNKVTIGMDGGVKVEKIEQIEKWWESGRTF